MTIQDTLNAMEAGEVKPPINSRVRPDPCSKCSNPDCAKTISPCMDRLFYAHELLPWLEYSLMATVEELNRIHRLKTEARLKYEAEYNKLCDELRYQDAEICELKSEVARLKITPQSS